MVPIAIKFQAFIPKSLGKPLRSYFEEDPRFKLLTNKEAFIRKLEFCDSKGFTWLPEPLNTINDCYFATDKVDFHHPYSDHAVRLGFHAEIDPKKIGNYTKNSDIFKHDEHERWGGVNSQHSGESHQVQAFIRRTRSNTNTSTAADQYVYKGICGDISVARSDEDPLDPLIYNSKRSPSSKSNDVTTLIITPSAHYPFLKHVAPDIDFKVQIKLCKHLVNKCIEVTVRGSHNRFPAYELILGQKVLYHYNPADYGHTGPNPINLNTSKDFFATTWINLADCQVRALKEASSRGW